MCEALEVLVDNLDVILPFLVHEEVVGLIEDEHLECAQVHLDSSLKLV